MIQIKQIEHLSLFKSKNKRIELKYIGWEEPNRGQELVYYSLLIGGKDKTDELFSTKTIQCLLNEKIETEHPTKNFAFIPCVDFYLLNTLDNTKKSLKVYFRENGNTIVESEDDRLYYRETKNTIGIEMGAKGNIEKRVPYLSIPEFDQTIAGSRV